MDRRDEVIEMLLSNSNETKGAIRGDKIDAEDPLHSEKKVQYRDQLNTTVDEEMVRFRRAFYEEKLFIRSAISDLNKAGERLRIEMKETMNIGLEEIVNKQSENIDEMKAMVGVLNETSMSLKLDIRQSVDGSMLEMMTKQELDIDKIKSGNEALVNRMEGELKSVLTEKLTLLDQRTERIANTVDVRLTDAFNTRDNFYITTRNLIDIHYSNINASLRTIYRFLVDGYIYPVNPQYTDLVRLANVDDRNRTFGRLEVNVDGTWGTVCDDAFNNTDATVACSMFGYKKGTAYGTATKGRASDEVPIWFDDMECTGSEKSIFDCQHRGVGIQNCNHGEDVAIRCFI